MENQTILFQIMPYVTLSPAHFLIFIPKVGLPAQDDVGDTSYTPKTTSFKRVVAILKKGFKHLNGF